MATVIIETDDGAHRRTLRDVPALLLRKELAGDVEAFGPVATKLMLFVLMTLCDLADAPSAPTAELPFSI